MSQFTPSQEAIKAFNRAKVDLMDRDDAVFTVSLLLHLNHELSPEPQTADVDGLTIRINPDWFLGLTKQERVGLLAHEVWHVALCHMSRQGYRDPELWNKAADHCINTMLDNQGYHLPPGGLCDHQYDDMSSEQIYELLEQEENQGNDTGNLGGCGNDIRPAPESGGGGKNDPNQQNSHGMSASELENHVKDLVSQAATQAAMAGDKAVGAIPQHLKRQLDEFLNPKLPWNVILQNFVNEIVKDDYSWAKPSRRYLSAGYYMPSMHNIGVDEVAIAVDTSGSVTDEQFKAFLTEIKQIREDVNPKQLTIIDFDCDIKHVHELNQDDDLAKVSFSGWGGTDLQPVFDLYNKKKPNVLIVFSDLYCRPIEEDPGYPVIWVCVDNDNPTTHFGQLVHYSTDDL